MNTSILQTGAIANIRFEDLNANS